jgi:hypothetical protein
MVSVLAQTGLRPKACTRNLTRTWTEGVCGGRSSAGASAESNLPSGTLGRSVANARRGSTSDKGYSLQGDCVAVGARNAPGPNGQPIQALQDRPMPLRVYRRSYGPNHSVHETLEFAGM